MYALNLKNWWHAHRTHNQDTWVGRMVHDERFWPGVFAVALIGLFIGLIIWAGLYGETHPESIPNYPYTPYIY